MSSKSHKNSNISDDMSIEQPEEQFANPPAETEKKPEIPDEIREAKEKKWAEWTERAFKSNQQSSQQEDVLSVANDVNRGFIETQDQENKQEQQSLSSSDKWNGVANAVLKGAWKTAGSIFGFRVIEETVKLVSDAGEKSEQKKELVSMTRELAENVSEIRQLTKERLANANNPRTQRAEQSSYDDDNANKESIKESVNPVREKIKVLNEKLANSNLPDNEKEQMRKEITYILREYNNKSEEAEIGKRDKIKELMDLYINNKAQGMLVAKEALNTASIALAQPYLRILGYSGFAVAERVRKANEMYDKAHFRESGSVNEKLKAIAKDLFINSAVETVNGFNVFNKEKSYVKRGIDFASSIGVILRFVGLAEYEHAIQAGTMVPADGAKKLMEAAEEGRIGDALGQMGENWLGNAKRLLSIVGITEKEGSGVAWAASPDAEGEKIYQPIQHSKSSDTSQVLTGLSQKIKDIGLEPEKLKGFSSEQIEKLASAENIGLIKSGGSVSEALNLKMPLDATVTVINPDGSVLENFDANLAHAGDTVAQNADGGITVFKTSDITVKEGQSLLGIYQQIESAINKENIPNEIRDVFNEGNGYWGEKITRSEANRILEWWHDNKNEFGKMSSEKQKEFLSGLKGAHSKDELNRLFNESLGKAGITKEAAVSVTEVVAPKTISLPMEEKAAPPPEGWKAPFGLSKDHILSNSNTRASHRLAHIYETEVGPWEGGRIEEYEQIKNTKAVDLMSATDLASSTDGVEDHKEQLAAYLRYLENSTGIQPNPTEAIGDYILRGERYLHDQSAAWNEAVSNPETRMDDKNWDIIDKRTPKERIDSNAWSQEVKAGKISERASVTENAIMDSKLSIRNKITEIFNYKNNTELENIKEWGKVKTQQTSDVINGKFETSGLWGSLRKFFGKSEFSVTNKNDLAIMGQHRTLRGYLNELREKVPQVDPKGKNVETYLQETERILSMKKAAQGEFSGTQEELK